MTRRHRAAALAAAAILPLTLATPASAAQKHFACDGPDDSTYIVSVTWRDYGNKIVVFHSKFDAYFPFYRFYEGRVRIGGKVIRNNWTSYQDPTWIRRDVTLYGKGPRRFRFTALLEDDYGNLSSCFISRWVGK
jgi:hypothetical protein